MPCFTLKYFLSKTIFVVLPEEDDLTMNDS